MKKPAIILATIILAGSAWAGWFSFNRRMVIPGMADLPAMDGVLDDWALDQARVPGSGISTTGDFTGDIYLSWLPEGVLVAVSYNNVQEKMSGSAQSGMEPCRLVMGLKINDEMPVAFALVGLQQRNKPANPASPFMEPAIKSVRGGIPFPTNGRFIIRQGETAGKKTLELFLPARLFGREEIDQADTIRIQASLLAPDNSELYWPRQFRPVDFWKEAGWAAAVFGNNPGALARRAKAAAENPPETVFTETQAPSATLNISAATPESATNTILSKGGKQAVPPATGKLAMTKTVLSPPTFKPGGGRIVRLETILNKPARITVIVYDRRNNIIIKFPEQGASRGAFQMEWNGVRKDGRIIQGGKYQVEVIATNGVEVASMTAGLEVGGR